METFSAEDILIDNLSFKLNKGASYINDRRSVSFFPSGSNIYTPSSGQRVLKIALNAEDNSWLDPQSVMVYFTVENTDTTDNKRLRPLSPAYSFFRRVRLIAGNQLVEDIDYYNRNHHMMSCMMSKGARDNEDAQSFGYRYDDDLNTRRAVPASGHIGPAYDAYTIPGFRRKMVVGFKPMLGLFNQFKYIPLKACPLVLELELVSNFSDCVVTVGGTRFPESGNADSSLHTNEQFSISNAFLQTDLVSLDNDLHNKYVAHLLDSKELPITYNTYICQSNQVPDGSSSINTTVVRSVSKLVAAFISFNKSGVGDTHVMKEYNNFYHPMYNLNYQDSGYYNADLDLEFQLQLGSKLYPEYPCRSLTQAFYYLRKALNLPLFHQHHLSIEYSAYRVDKFIFAMNFEKVPDSSYSGINTKAGQQLLIRVKPIGNMATANMPDTIYITLVSEQILSIRDAGVQILD